jgi:hypothetical protein
MDTATSAVTLSVCANGGTDVSELMVVGRSIMLSKDIEVVRFRLKTVCLPCTSCNRLRWHRRGAAIRELLVLGLIAKSEIEKLTETGKGLVRLRAEQTRRTARRRKWRSVGQINLRDPVLIEEIRQKNRQTLIRFLKKHLKRSFTAAELSSHTGVAKKWVRRLLDTSLKVSVIANAGRYTFQSRPPKKRA